MNNWKTAVTLSLLLLTTPASAKLPEGYTPSPEESAWFKSLKQDSGASCCSEQVDCRKVPAGSIRANKSGQYEFHATVEIYGRGNGDDEWHIIPPEKIQHRADNPTGEWVICWLKSLQGYVAGGSNLRFRAGGDLI